jgi:hypothetical protein
MEVFGGGNGDYHRVGDRIDPRGSGSVGGAGEAEHSGVAVTPGIDWIELIVQVALAALGVSLVAGLYWRRRTTGQKVKDAFKS